MCPPYQLHLVMYPFYMYLTCINDKSANVIVLKGFYFCLYMFKIGVHILFSTLIQLSQISNDYISFKMYIKHQIL